MSELPSICVCEVNRRWPNSYASRVELLQELVRRHMLSVERKCHLTFSRPIGGEPGMRISLREVMRRWPQSCQARADMLMELTSRGFITCDPVNHEDGTEAVWSAKARVWKRVT